MRKMSRYIDADIIDTILDGAIQGEEVTGNPPIINAHDLVCMLNDIPTAEVAEVRHGRWLNVEPAPNHLWYCTCSVCGERQTVEVANYCPMCGAKMLSPCVECEGGYCEDECMARAEE